MQVILLKNVPSLGEKFDLKNVKPGYARNFLIPQKLAIPATKGNLTWQEKELARLKLKEEQRIKSQKEMLEKLNNLKLEIPVKTGIKGELFEKINSSKIVEVLEKQGFKLKKENIILKESINKVGEYLIKIKLGEGMKTEIKVKVLKEK
jgi:large subunit ribosomal protein L9